MTTANAPLGEREARRLAKIVFAGQGLDADQLGNAVRLAVGNSMTEAVSIFTNLKKMREAARGKENG